jgi:hypothetical protein
MFAISISGVDGAAARTAAGGAADKAAATEADKATAGLAIALDGAAPASSGAAAAVKAAADIAAAVDSAAPSSGAAAGEGLMWGWEQKFLSQLRPPLFCFSLSYPDWWQLDTYTTPFLRGTVCFYGIFFCGIYFYRALKFFGIRCTVARSTWNSKGYIKEMSNVI